MPLQWNGEQLMRDLRQQAARNLLATAVTLQVEHMKRLSIDNPPPYLNPAPKGAYPHKRTGFGQANIVMAPTSISEVAQTLSVRVGVTQNAAYMAYLEVAGWKGLLDTLADLRSQLAAIAGGSIGTR